MLALTRRPDESFRIFDNITITINKVTGKKVCIAVDTPHVVPVNRLDPPGAAALDNGSQPHPAIGAAALASG